MNKNEYRRALIMLRPRVQGYTGHARLERRVMMGSLDFIVAAPQGDGRLEAVLAGQRGGEYYAASLGALRRDRRGQAALAWSFDPRNIEGRPLEAYSLAAVARVGPEDGGIVLAGNVDGARPLDMAKVEAAVRARLRSEAPPAADLPDGAEGEAETADPPDTADGAAGTDTPEGSGAPRPDDGLSPEEAEAEMRIFTRIRPSPMEEAPGKTAAGREGERAPDAAGSPGGEVPADPAASHRTASLQAAEPPEEPTGTGDPAGEDAAGSAEAALGLDPDAPWTGALEPLRALFARSAPVDTLDDGFVYVSAPLWIAGQADARFGDECRIGLRATEGRVDALRYAIPALYAPEPPEGLEGYAWAGNDTHGYWVLTADPSTGRAM